MSRFLRRKELLARYGIANTTLYRWIEEGRFPPPLKLAPGAKAAGWLLSEIENFERANIKMQREAADARKQRAA